MDTKELGSRIRKIRSERGMLSKDLAAACGVSAGLISQIEQGKTSPSIATLEKIAEKLMVPLVSLLSSEEVSSSLIRANERPATTFNDVVIELITPSNIPNFPFYAFLAKKTSGFADSEANAFSHKGYETYFILEGTVKWHVGDQVYELGKGDALSYNSEKPHWVEGPSDDFCCISIVSER